MLSRRALVGKAATVAAGAAVLGGVRGASASVPAVDGSAMAAGALPALDAAAGDLAVASPTADGGNAAPWALLSPLKQGDEVAHGWRLSEVSDISHGASVLTLSSDAGRTARVHLCRNDGRTNGIAATARHDLLLMNGGEGEVPTDERLAHAVAALARVVAANEASTAVGGLMTHDERLAEFSARDGAWLR